MKKFRKYFIKSIVVILILLSFAVSIFLIYRHIQRNKNESPITTEKGIDTEEIVEIGGIKQYLSIRGHDANNPILLVLHGGPGNPLSSEQYLYQRGWEKYYTVVNWDQRNAGKTYFLNDPEKTTNTLSISRAMEDTREIVSYLKEKFKKDNVIILGHSWGTILGTTFAQNYPEDVGAYIGVSQAIDVLNTEKNGYEKTLQAVKTAGDEKAFEYLSKYPDYPLVDGKYEGDVLQKVGNIKRKYLQKGITVNQLRNFLFSPDYTLKDITYYFKDIASLQSGLFDELFYEGYTIKSLSRDYSFPVFYIMGESDGVTPPDIAKEYFNSINAPHKEFLTVKNSGHYVMINNSEALENILINKIYSHIK